MQKRQCALAATTAISLMATATSADAPKPAMQTYDEPILIDGRLVYPEGAAIPRFATPIEQSLGPVQLDPLRAVTPPPTGPIHCVAEYEPMEGVLLNWEGPTAWTSIVAQMTSKITNEAGSKVYMVVNNQTDQNAANSGLVSGGANMSRVQFVQRSTNSIWIRDYGPRYIYEGDCRAIIDHTYNIPRPLDDQFSIYFAQVKNHAFYEAPLVHGGGNYHLNSLDEGAASRLIVFENPSHGQNGVIQIWRDYWGIETRIHDAFPQSVDATRHIDMWMQIIGPRTVMISDWPNNVGSTQDNICDNTAALYTSLGWTVHRLPARNVSGIHYTYTNVTMVNDIILVPTYQNTLISGHNAPALATWTAAAPDKQIFPVVCDGIIGAAGAMHCICMHVPVHRGGVNPTAYLKNLRGGETLNPGDLVDIRWISDDDVQVTDIDVLLSTNGGATWPTVIAAETAPDGSHLWTVPDIFTNHARIRIVARDASGNTGFDSSPESFTINGTPTNLLGDMNCDSVVTVADIGPFVMALTDPAGYAMQFPACDINNADMNDDDNVTVADIGLFVSLLTGG